MAWKVVPSGCVSVTVPGATGEADTGDTNRQAARSTTPTDTQRIVMYFFVRKAIFSMRGL
jgi:hypothetical protein